MAARKSLSERLDELSPTVEPRLRDNFSLENISYPPEELCLLVLKEEKVVEVYAKSGSSEFRLVKSYPILAASGHLGPKLREGDRQVPEGIYRVDFLNPNSLYHLSIKLNYPNEFDRLKAQNDNRFSPGSNIMLHGNQVSTGCIAIGDEPIEDLFLLAAKVGIEKIKVIIAPIDFRKQPKEKVLELPGLPKWAGELYKNIEREMNSFTKS
jgi:murein L,D-transpeptidase YafK